MNRRSKHITAYTSVKSLSLAGLMLLIGACDSAIDESASPSKSGQPASSSSEISPGPDQPPAGGLTDETAPDFLKAYAKKHSDDEVVISTEYGDIKLRLYQNTPMHRANFIYLTREDYFDDTWFYRVSPGHVIQGGNNDDSETGRKRLRIGDFKIPNEIGAGNLHMRGALAAARTYYQNPDKKSNPYEFYIVLGKSYTPRELELLAEKEGFGLTEKQKQVYAELAGSPHLDEEHTVFGEVIEGMDVVEAISRVEIDDGEWPLENIPIRVEVIE